MFGLFGILVAAYYMCSPIREAQLGNTDAVVQELTKEGGGHIVLVREHLDEERVDDRPADEPEEAVRVKTLGRLDPEAIRKLIEPNEVYLRSHRKRLEDLESSIDFDDPEQVDKQLRTKINIVEHELIVRAYRNGDYWVYRERGDTIRRHPDLQIWYNNKTMFGGDPAYAAVFVRNEDQGRELLSLQEQLEDNFDVVLATRVENWNRKSFDERRRIMDEVQVARKQLDSLNAKLGTVGRRTSEGRRIHKEMIELKILFRRIPDGILVDPRSLLASVAR
jgi:hypothetical protein